MAPVPHFALRVFFEMYPPTKKYSFSASSFDARAARFRACKIASFMSLTADVKSFGNKSSFIPLLAVVGELFLQAFDVDFAWCDILLQGLDGCRACGLPHVHAAEDEP